MCRRMHLNSALRCCASHAHGVRVAVLTDGLVDHAAVRAWQPRHSQAKMPPINALSDAMTGFVVQFARTGNPAGGPHAPEPWQRWTRTTSSAVEAHPPAGSEPVMVFDIAGCGTAPVRELAPAIAAAVETLDAALGHTGRTAPL